MIYVNVGRHIASGAKRKTYLIYFANFWPSLQNKLHIISIETRAVRICLTENMPTRHLCCRKKILPLQSWRGPKVEKFWHVKFTLHYLKNSARSILLTVENRLSIENFLGCGSYHFSSLSMDEISKATCRPSEIQLCYDKFFNTYKTS